jgi:decaprenylphospho-beta-D-ribofuranose 2-oxidase
MSHDGRRLLSGWGRATWSSATVVTPTSVDDVVAAVAGAGTRGLIPRGLGRSYGDQAQNAGGVVVDTRGLDRVLQVDAAAGTVTVQSGVRLGTLARVLDRYGLALPVVPGTQEVTVGGAVAADVHGKNHHRDGSFGRYVTRMTVVTADGAVRELRPQGDGDGDAELFWGTLGGLGLTGLVVDVDLEVLRPPSPWLSVDVVRAGDLDELLAALARADQRRYSAAWVDCLARGRRAGRGVVTAADHADPDEVHGMSSQRSGRRVPTGRPARVRVPAWVPPGLLNRWSAAAFNDGWYRASRPGTGVLQEPSRVLHPLDGVADWNRLYGPRGFVQYQCVVPDVLALTDLLSLLRSARAPALLAVVKRLGDASPGSLAFPRPGWTLAVDLPAGTDGLAGLLDELDTVVAEAGGSVYLVKDARLQPELVPVFYPRLEAWRALRERVDPSRRWQSDIARRLSL